MGANKLSWLTTIIGVEKSPIASIMAIDKQLKSLLYELNKRVLSIEDDISDLEDLQHDYAGIYFEDGSATTIDMTDVFHLIAEWDTNGPETVSDADHTNNRIVLKDDRVYEISFQLSGEVSGANQDITIEVFAIKSLAGKSITDITQADPGVVTSAGHGLSDGDRVKIINVVGMTEVNDKIFTVANKTDDTFELNDDEGANVDTSGYGAYTNSGTAYEAVKTYVSTTHRFTSNYVGSCACSYLYSGTTWDYIELYVKNKNGVLNFDNEDGNLMVHGV